MVILESVPTGADVYDGERRIGATPLQISIDKVQAQRQARSFTLRHPGYQPYSVVQGYSDDNVRLLASMSPEPPPVLKPAESAAAPIRAPVVVRKPAARPRPAASHSPAAAPPSDIRLQR